MLNFKIYFLPPVNAPTFSVINELPGVPATAVKATCKLPPSRAPVAYVSCILFKAVQPLTPLTLLLKAPFTNLFDPTRLFTIKLGNCTGLLLEEASLLYFAFHVSRSYDSLIVPAVPTYWLKIVTLSSKGR